MTATTIQVGSRGDLVVLTVGNSPEIIITVTEAVRFTALIEGAIATAQALHAHVTRIH